MATHYKGQRIDELLGEIATIEAKLNQAKASVDADEDLVNYSTAWTAITLAKAKLTALQGDDR